MKYIIIAFGLALFHNTVSATCINAAPSTSDGDRFVDNGETVTDIKTGLMWRKCLLGQSGEDCTSGTATTHDWGNALAQSSPSTPLNTYTDWRLPNIKELQSIIDEGCSNPAINEAVFPNAVVGLSVWSSTPYAGSPRNARYMSYFLGEDENTSKNNTLYVRLVRDSAPIFRQLVDGRSNLCMEVSGGTMANGTNVALGTCSPSHDGRQGWWFNPLHKRFHSQKDDSFCLDNEGGNGTVKIWSCVEPSSGFINNQRWDWDGDTIRPRPNRSLAVNATGTGAGSNINHISTNGNAEQNWYWLTPINQLREKRAEKCIDVTGGAFTTGTNIQLYTCVTGSANQIWLYNPSTEQIVSGSNYNYCLDNTGSVGNGQNIHLWTCDSNNINQKFIWKGDSIRLRANTNITIDAFGTGDGANIGQYTTNGQPQQMWRFRAP